MPWELYWIEKKELLEFDIWKKSWKIILGVLKGDFWGFGFPDDTQTPCWLRLWEELAGALFDSASDNIGLMMMYVAKWCFTGYMPVPCMVLGYLIKFTHGLTLQIFLREKQHFKKYLDY